MRIVLTNDDGYDAPGLAALWEAVSLLPDADVSVIAPSEPSSGKGHAISAAVRTRLQEVPVIGRVLVVEGTPGDCARVAVSLPRVPRPDWLISGINQGSNIGIDVFYSGTVAAAREAAILGIPSMAVSQLHRSGIPEDWARTTSEAAAVIAALLRPGHAAPPGADARLHAESVALLPAQDGQDGAAPAGKFWNINLPRPVDGSPARGVQLVPLSRDPLVIKYVTSLDEQGRKVMRYTGKYHERQATPGTDVATVFGGHVAISLVSI
jgi:5'-nucleotidase